MMTNAPRTSNAAPSRRYGAWGRQNKAMRPSGVRFLTLLWFTLGTTLAALLPAGGASASTEPLEIVAIGDSLTAGYQLPPGAGFPEQLNRALKEKGHEVKVTNAGVSGDTSSGGLARLDWALSDSTDIVILELGSNDALRGIDPALTRQNLAAMIEKLQARGITVVLAGMLAPPNMGADYGEEFNRIFPDLAERYGLILYPFFLDGVAANPDLNLADGMHPTQEGVHLIVTRILPTIEQAISQHRQTAATN